jgi:hypothetical protein
LGISQTLSKPLRADDNLGFCTYILKNAKVHKNIVDFAFHPAGEDLWIQPTVPVVSVVDRDDCFLLHYHCGNGQKSFLQEGEIVRARNK